MSKERREEITHFQPLQHILRIHLDSTDIKLHRADMLDNLLLSFLQQSPPFLIVLAHCRASRRLFLRGLCFQRLHLDAQELLGIDGRHLEPFIFQEAEASVRGPAPRVADDFFIDFNSTAFDFFLLMIVVGGVVVVVSVATAVVALVDVDAPALADAFDVETFAEDADLAPRVPMGRDDDLVAFDDVVF